MCGVILAPSLSCNYLSPWVDIQYIHSVCGCSWFHLKPVDGREKKTSIGTTFGKGKVKKIILFWTILNWTRVPVEKKQASSIISSIGLNWLLSMSFTLWNPGKVQTRRPDLGCQFIYSAWHSTPTSGFGFQDHVFLLGGLVVIFSPKELIHFTLAASITDTNSYDSSDSRRIFRTFTFSNSSYFHPEVCFLSSINHTHFAECLAKDRQ